MLQSIRNRIFELKEPLKEAPKITKSLQRNDILPQDLYDTYRKYVIHQYALVNHRTVWYIGFQSFLFGAFAITLHYKVYSLAQLGLKTKERICSTSKTTCINLGFMDFSMIMFAIIGIVTSVIFFLLIIFASKPIHHLYECWETFRHQIDNEIIKNYFPLLTGGMKKVYAELGRELRNVADAQSRAVSDAD